MNEKDRGWALLALQLVALATGVPLAEMTNTKSKGRACRARWMAIYMAHVTYGWPMERVGLAFGMNRSTVAHACRWGEDGRDWPSLDAALDRLDACVRHVLDGPACELPA